MTHFLDIQKGWGDVIRSRQAKGCKSGLIPIRGKKYIIIIIIIITITMNLVHVL